MTLWNIIRDFFVQYVFGGTLSNGSYVFDNTIGSLAYLLPDGTFDDVTVNSANELYFFTGGFPVEGSIYSYAIKMSDWLSTTATIITLIGLFIAITMFIIKLVKWISNTIAMR